jgi:hypothetical protein
MINFGYRIKLDSGALQGALGKVEAAVATEDILHKISVMLFTEFTRSMRSGLDPSGKHLPSVEPWTRRLGVTRGKNSGENATPLVNTGNLSRNMGTKELTSSKLVFGFEGKFQDIANAMQKGTSGFMRIKEKRIKGFFSGIKVSKKGGMYCRIKGSGGWFTKRVYKGNSIVITPKKRHFFYLSKEQRDKIDAMVSMFTKQAIDSFNMGAKK